MQDRTAPRPSGAGEHARKVIVLAEDDDELRRVLSAALELSGYQVIQVGTGARLIEEVRRIVIHLESPGHIDLVISDVRMPTMNGLLALQLLRDAELQVPVILITAFGDRWTRAEAALHGALLLQKPVALAELRATVAKTLSSSAGR